MKIFSWVHRRFHKKSVADEDAKKAENAKVSLLENEALAGVCDGWKEGTILAIGTLGIDLSKTFQAKDVAYTDNQLFFGHEDDEEDQEGEMEWPLLLKASKHGFHHVQKQDPSCDKVAKPNNGKEEVDAKDSTILNIECTEKKIVKSGERTTLADLLWGDSEKNLLKEKLCDPFNVPYYVSTGTESIKSTLISKKKKIERNDFTHPIKKTKRLIMRKMLKKKIHPDIASQKKETEGIICQDIHAHAT